MGLLVEPQLHIPGGVTEVDPLAGPDGPGHHTAPVFGSVLLVPDHQEAPELQSRHLLDPSCWSQREWER